VAVADGDYNMEFKLYTTSTGGTAVWTETLTLTNKVTVTNGTFSVLLGNVESLSGVDFNQNVYLGVNIGGSGSASWDGEMTPRKQIASVPSAFEAGLLDGLDSTQFVRSDTSDTIASSSVSTLLSIVQSGVGNILSLFDGATEVFTVKDGGNIGIGTTAPLYKLDVAGDIRTTGTLYATSTEITNLTMTNASTTQLTVSDKSWLGTVSGGVWNGTIIGDDYLTKTGDWTGTFDGQQGSYYLDADNLTDFGNPFYTYFNATTTTALSEGTNLYYTDVRVADYINASTTMPVADWNTAYNWGDHAGLYDTLGQATSTKDWLLTQDNTWTGTGDTTFAGNVGIGTTSPLALLDVYGNGIFSGLTNNSRYLNFGDIVGETGYGLRNRLGVIETKDNGDTNWQAVGTICPATMVDTDGNVYDVVKIGNQCWMAENLNVGTRIDGVDEMADTGTIEKYCYDDNEANCTTYGGLYQWDEAMQYTETEGTQGICSTGWHIPTDAEQNTLDQYLTAEGGTCDTSRSGVWDCAPAGTALKELGSSGFEAVLSGDRDTNGAFYNSGTYTYFWSSSVSGANAWGRYLRL